MGYSRAGFTEIVGVDLEPQPRYPFEFHQGDALEYLAAHWQEFDAYHASPPCQAYSVMHNLPWMHNRTYPLLILPTREAFNAIGKPYVIENVMGARHGAKGLKERGLETHGMQAGWLCGAMFGLPLYRHRLFETNWLWLAPEHPKHRARIAVKMVYGDSPTPGQRGIHNKADVAKRKKKKENLAAWPRGNGAQKIGVGVGHAAGWRLAAKAMGVEWMDRKGTTQAVPPAYTAWIGKCLMQRLQSI